MIFSLLLKHFKYVHQVTADYIDSNFYDDARRLLVVIAQRGGNPNMATFYSKTRDPVTGLWPHGGFDDAQISAVLAHGLRASNPLTLTGTISIVEFFYRTLSNNKLHELAEGIRCFAGTEAELPTAPFRAVLHRLTSSTPRPLRLMCRIAIANYMDWRLANKRCSALPLPRSLLQSLVNFDML